MGAADLEEMIADTSEAAVWSLSDALLEGDAGDGAAHRRAADRPGRERHRPDLRPRLPPAQRLRRRRPARGGDAAEQVESSLKMHPYAAKQLVAPPARRRPRRPAPATETLAELELWCRGGADYGDELALHARPLRRRSGGGRRPCYLASGAGGDPRGFGLLAAPVFLCRAPFCTALSIFEISVALLGRRSLGVAATRPRSRGGGSGSSRCWSAAGSRCARARCAVSASSVRLCWPCRVPEQAPCRLRAAADYSD